VDRNRYQWPKAVPDVEDESEGEAGAPEVPEKPRVVNTSERPEVVNRMVETALGRELSWDVPKPTQAFWKRYNVDGLSEAEMATVDAEVSDPLEAATPSGSSEGRRWLRDAGIRPGSWE
jgi:hypothetical protein